MVLLLQLQNKIKNDFEYLYILYYIMIPFLSTSSSFSSSLLLFLNAFNHDIYVCLLKYIIIYKQYRKNYCFLYKILVVIENNNNNILICLISNKRREEKKKTQELENYYFN